MWGWGEISFVNQKHPGRGAERSGFSPTTSLLKKRLNVAALIGPQRGEGRIAATVGVTSVL